jgi:hypothetical protein
MTMPLQCKLLVSCNLSIVPCDGEEGENWQQLQLIPTTGSCKGG